MTGVEINVDDVDSALQLVKNNATYHLVRPDDSHPICRSDVDVTIYDRLRPIEDWQDLRAVVARGLCGNCQDCVVYHDPVLAAQITATEQRMDAQKREVRP